MFTRENAEELGWVFEVDGTDGTATKYGEVQKQLIGENGEPVVSERGMPMYTSEQVVLACFQVTSDVPLFVLIADAAAYEGQPLYTDASRASVITPEFVAEVSGEVYAPEPADDTPPPPDAATANLLAAVEAVTSASDFEAAKANLAALIAPRQG